MEIEKLMPRDTFQKILKDCLGVLENHGFTSQTPDSPSVPYENIFKDICFGLFDGVEEKKQRPKLETNLDQKKLDYITLECALAMIRNGVSNIHYNETLNIIRSVLADILEKMGYENPEELCLTRPLWGCYKLWVEVAKKSGMPDKEIIKTREYFKKYRGGANYEK